MRFFDERKKAIAAFVVPIVVFYLARFGLPLTDEQCVALATIITGVVVHEVPNAD